MLTATEERQKLHKLIDSLPDDRVGAALVAIEECLEPNEDTIAAMEDVIAGRGLIGPFANAREMMIAALSGDDDDV